MLWVIPIKQIGDEVQYKIP